MKTKIAILVGALFVCLFIIPAHASLFTGQTIEAQFLYPDLSTPYGSADSSVVSGAVEVLGFPTSYPIMDIDYSDTNILMTMLISATGASGSFNGIRFTDINGTIPAITGVTLNAVSMPGFSSSNISFDADHIWFDFDSVPYTQGGKISLDVNSGAVPEPTTLLLLGLGMVGIAGLRTKFSN